ncbi:hypothetical protein Tco_0672388 [Tanacetum coccineum]
MNPIATQQAALDNALVPPKKRLKIERCNAIIAFSKPQREETYKVTLEDLKLSPCYPAFLITAEVPKIYMHQFWNTVIKIRDTDAYNFKLEKKMFRVDTEELGYSGKCNTLSAIYTDQMHQPWRTFAAIINRYVSGKTIGLDRLKEARAQILWVDNREISSARKEHIPYPRFTKVIINHFISKDKRISMRNMINLHIIRDDSLLDTLKFVSKTQDYQQYGALIPDEIINQDIKDSNAYKTYYDFATRKVPPRKARKYKKVSLPSRKLSPVTETEPVKKDKEDTPGVSVSKKKSPAKADRSKGIEILFDVALSEAAQLKEATKRSKKDLYISQASGKGDGTDFESGVPDEQQHKTSGDSEDDNDDINDDDNDDDSENEDDDGNDAHDSERTDSNDDDENPSFTLNEYDKEEHDEEYESNDDNENVFEEDDDDLYKDVDMRSLGAEHEKERKGDEEMTDVDHNVSQEKSYEQVIEDAHVTLTSSQKTESLKQSSSVSSDFTSKFLILDNVPPVVDEVASMMNVENRLEESSTQAPSLFTMPETAIPETSTTNATTVPPTISMITPLPQLTTPSPAPTTVPTTTSIPALPDFYSLFGFNQRVSTMESRLSQLKQANHSTQLLESVKSQLPTMSTINESLENVILAKSSSQPKSTYEATVSRTEFELKKILLDKIEKSKPYQVAPEHRELYDGLTSTVAKPPKGSKSKESKTSSSKGTKSQPKSSGKSVQAEEPVFETKDTKIPQDQGGDTNDQPNVKATLMDDWFKKLSKPPTPDHAWNDGNSIDSRPPQK